MNVNTLITWSVLTYLTIPTASANLDDEIRERCKAKTLTKECVKEAEAAWLAKHATLIKRHGESLELYLANGKTKRLTDIYDKNSEFDSIRLLFFDYLKESDQFLIKEQYYEGEGLQLVDRNTGWAQKLDDLPVFSPDRKHFLTVSICEAYCRDRLQIWRRQDGGWFELVWSNTPYEFWIRANARWLSNAAIEITTQTPDPATYRPDKNDYARKLKHLKLQSHGWSFSNTQ